MAKIIRSLLLLIFLIGGSAFLFNSINENNLVKQRVKRIFIDALAVYRRDDQTLIVSKLATENLQIELSPSDALLVNSAPTSVTTKPTRIPTPIDPYANDPDLKDAEWGKAVQVSETGYRMKIAYDGVMTTPQETFQALNTYRNTKGKSTLTWDDRLARYALERATFVCKNGSDGHAGFSEYVEKQEGYKTLGFYALGENMSTHMRFTGTHLIEWMYAGDSAHDGNQLGDWSHVGIGIFEDCSALIFGNEMI